jgi:DNA polymerase alpha subunit B
MSEMVGDNSSSAESKSSTPLNKKSRASEDSPSNGTANSGGPQSQSLTPASEEKPRPKGKDGRITFPKPKENPVYAGRNNTDELVASMNKQLKTRDKFERSKKEPYGYRCEVKTKIDEFKNVETKYRYGFTSLEERAMALDMHMMALEKEMCEKASIGEVSAIGIPSNDEVWVCGRVINEADEGRLNKTSILIEGSRQSSQGRTTALDLSECPSFAVFPGQIIMVKGNDPSGRKMVAKQVIEGIPLPLPKTPVSRVMEFQHSDQFQGGAPLKVFVAAGPYATSANLDYQPLMDILIKAANEKPDVLILHGPFVDMAHPLLGGMIEVEIPVEGKNGELRYDPATYEEVFNAQVGDVLNQMFEYEEGEFLSTHVVLVPSMSDAFHTNVFPQAPLQLADPDWTEDEMFVKPGFVKIPFATERHDKRVHLVSNPCMFKINEVLFGCCSSDMLFALSTEEVSHGVPGNRLERLASHILRQHSFAPRFPMAPGGGHNLDLRQAGHWQMEHVRPDVLICPSRLMHMAADCGGTLVVNPGSLTKGMHGGTFAQLDINPLDVDGLRNKKVADPNEEIAHGVPARTSVRITRI